MISVSDTGYTNDELSLHWLKHFDEHSKKAQKGVKRLLILDGHGSHHTYQFIRYYNTHDIIPFSLPPHLTHILQPLDVAVFQPLKAYHAKAVDMTVRDGCINITKLEFLGFILSIRQQAFKEATIHSAFRKTGIVPFNPLVVLKPLEERQARNTTPELIQPTEPHSSPFVTPKNLRQLNKLANDMVYTAKSVSEFHEGLSHDLDRFVRGSLKMATELVQTKRDLSRTKLAETIARKRRAGKNTSLQSGGILTVEQGREMVAQEAEKASVELMKQIVQMEAKYMNLVKKAVFEAAKEARRWRVVGRLARIQVEDGSGRTKWLKRG